MEILKTLEHDKVKFIKLQFTDLFGMVKSVTIPVERAKDAFTEGIWFDGSSIDGFKRICESDMYLKPDAATYAVLPWRPKEGAVCRFICDVYTPDGKPFESDPRYILKKVLDEAKKEGYTYYVGPELEFFLFKRSPEGKPLLEPHDTAGYFDFSPFDAAADVRRDIIFALEKFGLEVEMSHHEVASGQHEIDFKYDTALRAADHCVSLKFIVKSVADAHNLHATFMPKPIFGENGSGMHVHQSIFVNGKNIFFDAKDPHNLSATAKHFIAGQLAHVRSMTAVIAPTVNSYKRLVPGYEAPVYIAWGQINRSALIRIPRHSEGKDSATRAELRCPDPSCNPYLAFAVMLKAGLDGIKKKMPLRAPIQENLYEFDEEQREKNGIPTLPHSLKESLDEFSKNEVIKSVFGKETARKYIAYKNKEWDSYRLRVTPWEHEHYFDKY